MGKRKKEKPMIPRKNGIFKGEAKGDKRQRLFEKESCRGVQNELSMAI
jgi:hypothetical protein